MLASFTKFHNDEEGLEALQVVMIIAIAAMVMVACSTVGKAAVTWMNGNWGKLKGQDLTGGGGAAGAAKDIAGTVIGGVGKVGQTIGGVFGK